MSTEMLSPHEPLTDDQRKITRSWWRFLNQKVTQIGTTATPLVIPPSVILTGGTVSSGGTIGTADLPASSLLGNSRNVGGQPEAVPLDPSLEFTGTDLGLAVARPNSLLGNAGTVAAIPGDIAIGAGLTLDPSSRMLSAAGSGGGGDGGTLAYTLPDRSGQVAALEHKVNDALTLALMGSGTSPGGGVSTSDVNTWTAAQRGAPHTLTDAATIAVDFSLANNFTLTLGGNRTLGNPTNLAAGQAGQIVVKQDATGSRTLAYGTDWKFPSGTPPVLSVVANATDILSYFVIDPTHIAVSAAFSFA